METFLPYLQPIAEFFLKWLSADEWQGMSWVIISILAMTESIKRKYIDRRMRKLVRNLIISNIGLSTGLLVAFYAWPDASKIPWWLLGGLAGPFLNMVHLGIFTVLWMFWPKKAAKWTGDKRKMKRAPL